ncbi:MAG: acyl-[acyl-carrier-protein] thioesterase [Bacillota bacterium]
MDTLVYERKIKIPNHEVDFTGHWRIASIFNEMQEISEQHGKMLGVSRKKLDDCGIFWVISRMRVHMQAYPTWGEEIISATWPHNIGSRIFPRCFRFTRLNGELLGQATTIYLLMDMKTQQITRAPEGIVIPDVKHADEPPALGLGKLITDQDMEEAGRRKPRYSDIDMNNHMNNERYAQWICDMFEPGRFRENYIETLQINFLAEARPNESITLFLHEEQENAWISGKREDSGTPVFEALCAWSGRQTR